MAAIQSRCGDLRHVVRKEAPDSHPGTAVRPSMPGRHRAASFHFPDRQRQAPQALRLQALCRASRSAGSPGSRRNRPLWWRRKLSLVEAPVAPARPFSSSTGDDQPGVPPSAPRPRRAEAHPTREIGHYWIVAAAVEGRVAHRSGPSCRGGPAATEVVGCGGLSQPWLASALHPSGTGGAEEESCGRFEVNQDQVAGSAVRFQHPALMPPDSRSAAGAIAGASRGRPWSRPRPPEQKVPIPSRSWLPLQRAPVRKPSPGELRVRGRSQWARRSAARSRSPRRSAQLGCAQR